MRGNSPSGIDAGKESDCSRPEGFYARLIKKPLPEFYYFFATFLLKKVPRQANSSQVCLHALASRPANTTGRNQVSKHPG